MQWSEISRFVIVDHWHPTFLRQNAYAANISLGNVGSGMHVSSLDSVGFFVLAGVVRAVIENDGRECHFTLFFPSFFYRSLFYRAYCRRREKRRRVISIFSDGILLGFNLFVCWSDGSSIYAYKSKSPISIDHDYHLVRQSAQKHTHKCQKNNSPDSVRIKSSSRFIIWLIAIGSLWQLHGIYVRHTNDRRMGTFSLFLRTIFPPFSCTCSSFFVFSGHSSYFPRSNQCSSSSSFTFALNRPFRS